MAQINFITIYKNNLQNYTFFDLYVHFFYFYVFYIHLLLGDR